MNVPKLGLLITQILIEKTKDRTQRHKEEESLSLFIVNYDDMKNI